MSQHVISNDAQLRSIYGSPPQNSLALRCMLRELDKHHRAFIALSPFAVIASADREGAPDVAPRGDLPGFVVVRDPRTLIIPDRPGNKKLVTFTNILENPAIALFFMVPGHTETLRVNGKARITTDPSLLAPLAVGGKAPLSALVVSVELAFFHCGRALIRSRLWHADVQVASDALPTLGRMLADQIAGVDAADAEARLDRANSMLWAETASATAVGPETPVTPPVRKHREHREKPDCDRTSVLHHALVRVGSEVREWRRRSRDRRALAAMSDLSLRDIGLTRYDAAFEASKPFWRA
jgi:PPOX class probable FMN-dependent enzyme